MNQALKNISTRMLVFLIISASFIYPQDSTQIYSGNKLPEILTRNISFEIDNLNLKEALHEFSDAAGLHISYSEDIIPAQIKVTVHAERKPVIMVLTEILKSTSLDFVVTKSMQIVLIRKNASGMYLPKKSHTISGFVSDAKTGESMIGTNIYIDALSTGTTTNAYGFYSITIPEDYYTVRFSYVGYTAEEYFTPLFNNITLNVELGSDVLQMDTVVVTSQFEKDFIHSTEMGTMVLSPVKLSGIPYLLGEQDILKTLQMLPGITFGREGDAGFYVRGGEFDQNLVMLDEAPVYSTFHSFGFFSVFNPDAIRNVKLIKGAAPPKYGGRLSSVLDIQMNEGNMKEFSGVAGLGLIFSRITLEGPLIKDKSSFIISGRRTYLDVFKLFSSQAVDFDFYFYDLNGKVNYKISENDRLYLSGYMGSDVLGVTEDFQMSWGNKTATLRWNHLFNDKLFLNSSLIYSQFKHETIIGGENATDDNVEILSKVNDLTIKEDFEYFPEAGNTFNFGMNYINHSFLPGQITVQNDNTFQFTIGKRNAHEVSLYASHETEFLEDFKIDYGFRSTLFAVKGEADKFNFSDPDDIPLVDFHANEAATYFRIEPRIALTYQLNPHSSIKTGYAMNHQYLHMLSNAISGTPFDVWQPSSKKVKPQESNQFSLGYFRNFEKNEYELSIEGYYKYLTNVIDLRDGANLLLKNYFESELVFGVGWAYGLEIYLKKNLGKLTGWLGYSIAKSERKIEEVNNGNPFPAKYDRTHDFSIVSSYEFNERWSVSANWIFSSGFNVTLPYGSYNVDNKNVEVFTSRNSYRLPPYHRLDLGVSYTNSLGGTWNFSVYNAYAHNNTYMVGVRDSERRAGKKEAIAYTLFSIVPSLSYTLKF